MAIGSETTLLPGFSAPVADAQRVFQACMRAMSRPGRVVALEVALAPPPPLTPEIAAVLLALTDHETKVWLDPTAARTRPVTEFLTFHTSARITSDLGDADFVVATNGTQMPPLARLPQGTPEFPDRAATLLVQTAGFRTTGLQIEGPGIDGRVEIGFDGLSADFATQMAGNRAAYPCGIDLILAAPGAIVGLPRSLRIVKGA
jgi:alpha-D-ribose 1-methylphosphonate 5-triphosphate synthase subunit PhnH